MVSIENFIIVSISEFGLIISLALLAFKWRDGHSLRLHKIENQEELRQSILDGVKDKVDTLESDLKAVMSQRNTDNMAFAEALGKFNLILGEFRQSLKSFEQNMGYMRTDFKDALKSIEERIKRD